MKKTLTLLAALALALTLLAGCGGQDDNSQSPAPDPAPATDQTERNEDPPVSEPAPQPEDDKEPGDAAPTETEPAEEEEPAPAGEDPADTPPEEPAPAPEPEPEPEPEPAPEPAPEPEETVPEDGTYTANVTLEGGTGRATVESPAVLRCEGGKFWAIIVWSSPNFDYMKVDGEKYPQTNTEGNSTFEIPVAAFDQRLDVIADTVAMSEPHEVEYTLIFDSASLTKQ